MSNIYIMNREEGRRLGGRRGADTKQAQGGKGITTPSEVGRVSHGGNLCGDEEGPPAPTQKPTQPRGRNTARGLRSQEAQNRRTTLRTHKRKIARATHRQEENQQTHGAKSENFKENPKGLRLRNPNKIKYGHTWRCATIKLHGLMRADRKEEIEIWMKSKNIDIAVIQETRTPTDTRETRKNYIWYFSGSNRTLGGYTDGAAIVIQKTNGYRTSKTWSQLMTK